jgi:hypothetical protein
MTENELDRANSVRYRAQQMGKAEALLADIQVLVFQNTDPALISKSVEGAMHLINKEQKSLSDEFENL